MLQKMVLAAVAVAPPFGQVTVGCRSAADDFFLSTDCPRRSLARALALLRGQHSGVQACGLLIKLNF